MICVGWSSSAVSKSRQSRLMKSLRVRGALSEGDVRRRIECNLTCPVNL